MLIKKPADIRSSEITDRKSYLNRRDFLKTSAGVAAAGAGLLAGSRELFAAGQVAPHGRKLEGVKPSQFSLKPEQEKKFHAPAAVIEIHTNRAVSGQGGVQGS